MCGLAGILGPLPAREATLTAMTRALAHRGPDGEGTWIDRHCALGHRRLAVLDPSPDGAQPMTLDGGRLVLAYNGEVYNFRELSAELARRGRRLRSRTDTEVLLHLYDERGDDFVRDLDGMFAFALWDAREGKLLLARDRWGQKPLFVAQVGEAVVFGSEPKALLQVPGLSTAPSEAALASLLVHRFVPSPHSAFRAIRRLEPGTVETFSPAGERHVRGFVPPPPPRDARVTQADAERDVERLVRKAVERQLVADVPVGLFLSGGIDSTLVLSLAGELGARCDAFTVAFDERRASELPMAELAARRAGVRLHVETLGHELFARPEDVVEAFDEPFADVAAPLVAALSKRARGTITVALTGDGGDEVFAGYASHLAAYHAHEAGSHPVAYGAAIRALRTASALKVPGRSKFAKAARLLQQSPLAAAAELRAVANATEREALLQPRALRALAESGLIEATSPRGEAAGSLEGLFHPAFDPTLADLFLHKADVASMSASLECRTPFLDRALVDYVARLPLRHLVLGPLGKRIPRALVAKRFGARLGYRPKAGFSPPLDAWLRGPLSGLVRERLLRRDSALFDWVRPEVVTARAEAHLQGRADERRLLWTLLVLEAFLAGRAVRGAAP